jgi:hypothetical protein
LLVSYETWQDFPVAAKEIQKLFLTFPKRPFCSNTGKVCDDENGIIAKAPTKC